MATWWVNQGQTFEQEVRNGYLWAPKLTRNGRVLPAYEFMKEVRPGDVVFSYAQGLVRAVGLVTQGPVSWKKPQELGVDWNPDGWKIAVDYSVSDTPFAPKSEWELVESLLPTKYSPLTKNGTGVQSAYLSRISDELGALLSDRISAGIVPLPPELMADDEIGYALDREIWDDVTLEDTERETIVSARKGQGTFKKRVYAFEKACRVTGVSEPRLLIASHIKPWRVSDPNERLNGNNGLMLSPHIDILFDRGLLTFGNRGSIHISKHLPESVPIAWHIDLDKNVGHFTHDQTKFLEYHRDEIFERVAW